MNTIQSDSNSIINLDLVSHIMLLLSLFLLGFVALGGSITPLILYILMIVLGILMIFSFSNKNEIFLKTKIFIIIFSFYVIYTVVHHYILISFFDDRLPYVYIDEPKFYYFSELGLPYVSGEKNVLGLFSDIWIIHEFPLHVLFTSSIAYLSILIDGSNSIVALKMFAPFLGGLFVVVLYSTLKFQFNDTNFSINAVIIYSFFSAIFMYSTVMLRDIDITLTYMIFIYVFLQKNSYKNFFFLILIAFLTYKLRSESGLVLYGIAMLYSMLIIRNIDNIFARIVLYVIAILNISIALYLFGIITSGLYKYNQLVEGNAIRGATNITKESFSAIFDKLPFGISHSTKVLFGQIQPFPLFLAFKNFPLMLHGIFWPFVDIMMLYAIINANIRDLLNKKITALLMVTFVIFLLMSSEPLTRRMLSLYPVIYIIALYTFYNVSIGKIKKLFSIYLFGLITLNTIFYVMKI